MPPYLLGLRLAGRRVLVVGGGRVAQRRVPALLDAGADVVLVSPAVTATLEGLADHGRITWHQRPYKRGDCRGAWLVQAVTDDPGVNGDVVAEADAARIWAVRADDAEASPAWTPASGHAGDATVGVLLGGDP
ncbi:NAD(P)-dependent oxidoreductase, partial [Actinomadura bangladeshensis]|nr:bifunctional precorrin-2 dehydrogenase/sirohydrochlorin ferrochelatase [Actinomadura bangladeshensis]